MGNCLKTQLKAAVQNDNLPIFDTIVLQITALSNPPAASYNRVSFKTVDGSPFEVYTTGNYLVQNIADYNDPSKYVSRIPSQNSETNFYVTNNTYKVYIKAKSKLEGVTFATQLDNTDITSMSGIYNLTFLNSISKNAYGNIKDLKNVPGLNLIKTSETAEFASPNITGTIEGFVATQVACGRTIVSKSNAIFTNILFTTNVTFGGNHYRIANAHITWDSAAKIAFFSNAADIASCDKVYEVGYTTEEIAAKKASGGDWEGLTVYDAITGQEV